MNHHKLRRNNMINLHILFQGCDKDMEKINNNEENKPDLNQMVSTYFITYFRLS